MIPMLIFIIMMANVSVLSKLGKFFHPINPTRQYQACVLSTHRSKMLLSSATRHNHINVKNCQFIEKRANSDGRSATLSKMSSCVSLSILPNFFTHINLLSLPELSFQEGNFFSFSLSLYREFQKLRDAKAVVILGCSGQSKGSVQKPKSRKISVRGGYPLFR